MFIRHETIEKNAILLLVLTLLTVAIGGIVEIVPLFTIETTVEHVKGVRPYSPLELRGRDIYVREGCYLCHSQQIRALRDEVERYGHYSLAAESMYDHPFQWGSQAHRPGPGARRRQILQRLALCASEESRRRGAGIADAALCLPGRDAAATPTTSQARMRALRAVGVPYTDEMIADAQADLAAQADPAGRHRGAAEALSQGRPWRPATAESSPRWTRWWPICRCSARW